MRQMGAIENLLASAAQYRRRPGEWLRCVSLLAALLLAACGPAAGLGSAPAQSTPASASAAAGRQEPAPAAAFPASIVDDAGRRVEVKAAPQRIVSAAPSTTEIAFALGLGDRLAAVTTFCNYPEAALAKPKIGGLRPNLETIVAQAPDLVLAVRGTPPDAIAALEGMGVPVAILNPSDFAGVLANVRALGTLTGTRVAADRLADDMRRRWDAVAERARTTQARPRVFYEIDATDPAAVTAAGAGTFIDAMIAAAGGVNVVAALAPGQQYPRINAEAILQANPELIILGDAPWGQSAESVARRPGWASVQAVQRGAIATMSESESDVVSRAGPRLVEGLELFARIIHPELFGQQAAGSRQ
jgi:iron complex transport system substrate-binding protein